MLNDLYHVQNNLEKGWKFETLNRFDKRNQTNKEKKDESSNYYGLVLQKRAIEPLAYAIKETIAYANNGEAGRRHTSTKYLEMLDSNVISYLTCKTIINQITHERNFLTPVALEVANKLEDELRFMAFNAEKPWLWKKIKNESKSQSEKRKRKIIIGAFNRYCDIWESWPKTDKLHLGKKLIDLFIDATGFVRLKTSLNKKQNVAYILEPTQTVLDLISNNAETAALLSPILKPMVVKPTPWDSSKGGGYLGVHIPPLTLVKTQNRNYLEEVDNLTEEYSDVYTAINKLQGTPWEINKFVLDTFVALDERDLGIADLALREKLEKPPHPLGTNKERKPITPEEVDAHIAWKKRATASEDANVKRKSRRLVSEKLKSIAQEFVVFSEMYFPHTFDFRSRMYAVPNFLNPQGCSLSKGLLQFADGKPLGDDVGVANLAVHGANEFGEDKRDFQGRVDWVFENSERICAIADDPLSDYWWATDADSPWTFLAFCKEWQGYIRNGVDHINYLPCSRDATCSGLQILSACLKDSIGGSAVNLINHEQPADVYQLVIDKAIAKIKADKDNKNFVVSERAHPTKKRTPKKGQQEEQWPPDLRRKCFTTNAEMAEVWLDFGMSRKSAKRCTMTRVYGSTLYSAKDFIEEYISDEEEKRALKDPEYRSPFKIYPNHSVQEQKEIADLRFNACVYLAKHVWSSINETVIAAKDGMDWLRSVATILAKENIPITWTTIDGFRVQQAYNDTRKRKVRTSTGDKFVFLTLQEPIPDKLDSRRQANGVSPNFVHSLDATHCRMTIKLASEQPKPVTHFAMIHDSYGTHACDVETLDACIKEAFVQMYEDNNPLEMFRQDVQALTDTELPEVPPMGDLDIALVRESEFFFS